MLALLISGYIAALYLFFTPVQLRVWNRFGALDVAVMACLVLPFVLMPALLRMQRWVTRCAWAVAAVMALDVLFFAVAEFAPTGGHPSLESAASFFLALAKPVLVPALVALLSASYLQGERLMVVVTGFVCLVGETLYGTYPTDWWSSP